LPHFKPFQPVSVEAPIVVFPNVTDDEAVTTAVCADATLELPALFDPVTTTRTVKPTSAATNT
jgi:hypothetical protein